MLRALLNKLAHRMEENIDNGNKRRKKVANDSALVLFTSCSPYASFIYTSLGRNRRRESRAKKIKN